MPTYTCIIFDFDGTLADSAPWFVTILNELAQRHRFRQVSEAEIEMLRGRANREIVKYFRIPPWKMPLIAADLRRMSAAAADTIPLFPGVPELLADLAAAGMTVAVVSSNGEETIGRVLGPAAAAVRHYACGIGLFGKARRLNRLRKALRLDPARILCIGDEVRDIDAARQAGLPAAAVTWGYATEAVLRAAAPDHVFTSIPALRAALL